MCILNKSLRGRMNQLIFLNSGTLNVLLGVNQAMYALKQQLNIVVQLNLSITLGLQGCCLA